MSCPNKNTFEWNYLVQKVGEENAYRVFYHLDNTLPTTKQELDNIINNINKPINNPSEISEDEVNEFGDKYYEEIYDETDFNEYDLISDYIIDDYDTEIEDIELNYNDLVEFDIYGNKAFSQNEVELSIQYRKYLKQRLNTLFNYKNVYTKDNKLIELDEINKSITNTLEKLKKVEKGMTAIGLIALHEDDLEYVKNILNKKSLTENDISKSLEITTFWINIFPNFIKSKMNIPIELMEQYNIIQHEFNLLQDKIYTIQNNVIEKTYNNLTDNKIGNLKEYLSKIKDINSFTANTLNITRTHNLILSAIGKLWYDIQNQINKITDSDFKEIDKETQKVDKELKRNNEDYLIFSEKYKTGEITGNLINPFSPEYVNEKFKKLSKIKYNKGLNEFYKWSKDNEFVIDIRKLFPNLNYFNVEYSTEEVEEYKKEILEHITEEELNHFLEEQQNKIDKYNEILENYEIQVESNDLLTKEEKEEKVKEWQKLHSPYVYNYYYENNTTKFNDGYKFLVSFPKKFKQNKKSPSKEKSIEMLSYWNEDFNKIKDNEVYLNYWRFLNEKLNEYNNLLPTHKTKFLRGNSFIKIKKDFFETVKENVWSTPSKLIDILQNDISIDSTIDTNYQELDIAGNPIKSLPIQYFTNDFQDIKKVYLTLVENKAKELNINSNDIIFHERKGKGKYFEIGRELKKEATNFVNSQYSFNIGKLLKYHSLVARSYDIKNQISPVINITKRILDTSKESVFDDNNEVRIKNGLNTESSFKNTKEMFNYFYETFYGKTQDEQGKTKQKYYNKIDDDYKKMLEERLIDLENEYEKILLKQENKEQLNQREVIILENYKDKVKEFQDEINDLGKNYTLSRLGNKGLSYVQILGIGWNLLSATQNLTIGFIGNMIESSGRQNYSEKSYLKALSYSLTSVWRNFTFNNSFQDNQLSKTGDKIRNIMDYYKIQEDVSNILQDEYSNIGYGIIDKTKAVLSPFNLNKRTEYLNQSTVLLAMLFEKTKVINSKEYNYYELLDEDGKVKKEFKTEISDNEISDIMSEVRQVINRIHGDYNNPKLIKKKFLGRALTTFRTWMFEGIHSRFEKEKYDSILNRNVKGRYSSIVDSYFNKDNKFFIIQGIGKLTLDSIINIAGKTAFVNPLLKLAGKDEINLNPFIDKDNASELDLSNIRRNMTELYFWTMVSIAILLVKNMEDDDEEEKKLKDKRLIYTTINLLMRNQTDLEFYLNPEQTMNIIREPIPAIRVVTQWLDLFGMTKDIILGEESLYYTTGIYKGDNKILIKTAKLTPFANAGMKLYSTTKSIAIK